MFFGQDSAYTGSMCKSVLKSMHQCIEDIPAVSGMQRVIQIFRTTIRVRLARVRVCFQSGG